MALVAVGCTETKALKYHKYQEHYILQSVVAISLHCCIHLLLVRSSVSLSTKLIRPWLYRKMLYFVILWIKIFLACFAKAFQRVPRSMSSSVTSAVDMMTGSITALPEPRTLMYVFEVNLEIKEEDGKVILISHIYSAFASPMNFREFLLQLERIGMDSN